MNIALWIVQLLLATAFIAAAGMKNGPSGLNHGLVTFIGLAELAGAVGIVLPMAANVAPWLGPAAATGLAAVMLLAVLYHVRRHEPPAAPAVLLLLAVFVAVGRLAHWA